MSVVAELRRRISDIDFKLNNTDLSKKLLQKDRAFYAECLRAAEFYEYASKVAAGKQLLEGFSNE